MKYIADAMSSFYDAIIEPDETVPPPLPKHDDILDETERTRAQLRDIYNDIRERQEEISTLKEQRKVLAYEVQDNILYIAQFCRSTLL